MRSAEKPSRIEVDPCAGPVTKALARFVNGDDVSSDEIALLQSAAFIEADGAEWFCLTRSGARWLHEGSTGR